MSRSDFRMLWMTPDRALYRASFRAWHDAITPTTPPLRGAEQLRRRAFPASWAVPPEPTGRDGPAHGIRRGSGAVDLTSPSAWTEEPTRSLLMDRARTTALIFQEDPDERSAAAAGDAGQGDEPGAVRTGPSTTPPMRRRRICSWALTPGLLEMPSLDVPAVRVQRIVAPLPAPRAGVPLDLLAMREGARAAFGREVSYAAPTPEEAADWSLDLGEAVPSLAELRRDVAAHGCGPCPRSRRAAPSRRTRTPAPRPRPRTSARRRRLGGTGTPSCTATRPMRAASSGIRRTGGDWGDGRDWCPWGGAAGGGDPRRGGHRGLRRPPVGPRDGCRGPGCPCSSTPRSAPRAGLPPNVRQVHLGVGAAGAAAGRRLVAALDGNPAVAKAVAEAGDIVAPDGKSAAVRKAVKRPDVRIVEWTAFVDDLADRRRRDLRAPTWAAPRGARLAVSRRR